MATVFNSTSIGKSMYGHWRAVTEYALPGENRLLQVVTTKRSNGHTVTTYSACDYIGHGMIRHSPFSGDIHLTDDHGRVRLTEKLVAELHARHTEKIDHVIEQAETFRRKALGL